MSLKTYYKQLTEAHALCDRDLVEKTLISIDTQEVVSDPEMIKQIDLIRAWCEMLRNEEAFSQKYGRLIKELMQALNLGRLKEASEIKMSLTNLKQIPLPQMLEVRYNQLIALDEHRRKCRKYVALITLGCLVLLTLILSIYFVHQYKTEKKENAALALLKKQIDKNRFERAQKNLELLAEERPEIFNNQTFLIYQKKIKNVLSMAYKKQEHLHKELKIIVSNLRHTQDSSLEEKQDLINSYKKQLLLIKAQINHLHVDTSFIMTVFKNCENLLTTKHFECEQESLNKLESGIIHLNEGITRIYTYNLKNKKNLEKAKNKYIDYRHQLEVLQDNSFSKIHRIELELTHLQTSLERLNQVLAHAEQVVNFKHRLPEIKNYSEYKHLIKSLTNKDDALYKKLKTYDEIYKLGSIGESVKKLKGTDLSKWSNDKGFASTWQVSFDRAKALCHFDEMTHQNTLKNIMKFRNEWGKVVIEIHLTDSKGNKSYLYTKKMPKFLKNVQGQIVLCWIDAFSPPKGIQKVTLKFDSNKNEWILNSATAQKRFIKTNLNEVEKGNANASFITYSDSFLSQYTHTEPDERLYFLTEQWGKLLKIENLNQVWRYKIAYEIIHLASSIYSYDSDVFTQLMKNFSPDSKLEEIKFKEICAKQQTFRSGAIYVELLHFIPSGFLTKNELGILTLHSFKEAKEVKEHWSIERDKTGKYIFEKVANHIEPIQFLPSAHPQTYDYQLLWSPRGYATDSVRKLSYPKRPALWPRNVKWP